MSVIDVFISYKREERAYADTVSHALKEAGYVAVTDLNIQKATDFGEAIDRMIREATVVVVLWTNASAASNWVRKEASEAERLGKYLGVRVDAVTVDDLPLTVRNNNWLDLSGASLTEGLPRLLTEIRRLAGAPKRTQAEATTDTATAEKDLEFYQVVSEIGDMGGFRKYLELYPKGAYTEDAKRKIEGINAERDKRAYKEAKDIGAVGGFRKYIERFPKGAYVEDAAAFVRRNTGWQGILRKVPIFSIIAALGTASGAYIAWANFQNSGTDTASLERQISTLTAQKSKNEAEIKDLSERLKSAGSNDADAAKIALLEQRQRSDDAEIGELRDELKELQIRYDDLDRQNGDAIAKIQSLQGEVDSAQKVALSEERLSKAADAQAAKIEALNNQIATFMAENRAHEDLIDRLRNDAAQAEANVAAYRERYERFRAELNASSDSTKNETFSLDNRGRLLGAAFDPIDDALREKFGFSSQLKGGLVIVGNSSSGAFYKAGLRSGDLVIGIDRTGVTSINGLVIALNRAKSENQSSATVLFRRAGDAGIQRVKLAL